jgi:hypothetical protein
VLRALGKPAGLRPTMAEMARVLGRLVDLQRPSDTLRMAG